MKMDAWILACGNTRQHKDNIVRLVERFHQNMKSNVNVARHRQVVVYGYQSYYTQVKWRIFSIFLMIHGYTFHVSCPPDRRCSVHHSLLLEPLSIFCSPVEINKTQQNIPEYWTPRTLEPSSRLPRALVIIKQTLSYLTRKKVVIIRHMTHAFTKSKVCDLVWKPSKIRASSNKENIRNSFFLFYINVLGSCELWWSMSPGQQLIIHQQWSKYLLKYNLGIMRIFSLLHHRGTERGRIFADRI